MSIITRTGPGTDEVEADDTGAPTQPAPGRKSRKGDHVAPMRVRRDTGPRIGGAPRVDLLPQSIRDAERQKKSRRKLRYGLVGVLVAVAAGAVGTMQYAQAAQSALEAEQGLTLGLLAERADYAELIAVQERVALAQAAQTVGGSPEIDWSAYLGALEDTLPGGVELTAVTIDASSPVQVYDQSTGPLEGPRVATLTFTATSSTLPDVPVWLDSLQGLPAFVDAVPNSVTRDDGGDYLVNITMHIGADAFSGRFAAEGTEQK